MRLSFVVPAYNEEHYLPDCLDAILKQTADLAEPAEIIVVNNASTDRTREVALSYPGVRVVDEMRKGLTFARQAGFAASTGELIANVDADTRLPSCWLSTAEHLFASHPDMVCLSGPFRYYDIDGVNRWIAEGLWWITAPLTYRITGFMVLGANFIAKRTALQQIGGFDTNISFYGEDTNLALRLSKVGKVRFAMNFYILGSARRILKEGLAKTFWVYGMNYCAIAFRKGPYTKVHKDIR